MNPETCIEILEAGKRKLEEGWCKSEFGIDARGNSLEDNLNQACKVCAVGGLIYGAEVVFNDPDIGPGELPWPVLSALESALPPTAPEAHPAEYHWDNAYEIDVVASYNDDALTEKDDILALYDRAIALVKEGKVLCEDATA